MEREMKDGKSGSIARGEEFLQIFRRGMEFTRELLQENERLRKTLHEVERQQASAARDPRQWDKLREELLSRIEALEEERALALEQLQQIEAENRDFAQRYVEVEEENNNLANLYVASFQLHSTLHLPEVLKTVVEIVINLIGADRFAVYIHDEQAERLHAVAAEGERAEALAPVPLGQGRLGRAVASGEVFCADPGDPGRPEGPLVCIPLRIHEQPVGAIAVWSLLEQKRGFSALDRELFALLAGHAATAIFSARLYAQSERKRSTIQGFLDLLTK